MEELIKQIEKWAIDRELDKKATVEAQTIKTIEELSELIKGICKDDIELIKDSIGDVFVTLVVGNMIDRKYDWDDIINESKENSTVGGKLALMQLLTCDMQHLFVVDYDIELIESTIYTLMVIANSYELTLKECVESAYDEIKDRKGKMINGQFVKESDLK